MWLMRLIVVLLILWFIATLVGWLLRRALFKSIRKMQNQAFPFGQNPPSEQPELEMSLVQCAHCGTYITQNQAVLQNGQSFCSEHAK